MPAIGRKEFEQVLRHKVTPDEFEKIMFAYVLAKAAHRGQMRDNGERYFEHPKSAALILVQEFGVYDSEMIIAELLHDTVEDTSIFGDREDVFDIRMTNIFGRRVAELVRALTKMKQFSEEQERKYALWIVESADEDVQLLKLADRLHNLRTIENCDFEKQRRILEESIAIYLPCAKRIGGIVFEKFYEQCRTLQNQAFLELAEKLETATQ